MRDRFIRLDKNENAYSISKNIIKEIENYDIHNLRYCSNEYPYNLDKNIAEYFNLSVDTIISVSSLYEAFYSIINSFSYKKILIYKPYNDIYNYLIKNNSLNINIIEPNDDYTININHNIKNSINFITNPNSETSMYIDLDVLENVISKNKNSLFVIDESYIDLPNNYTINLINKYKNVIIIHSLMTYHSISSINVYFIISNNDNIKQLSILRQKYSINTLYESIIISSLKYKKKYYNNAVKTILERDRVEEILLKEGFIVFPSRSNFLLIRHLNKNYNKIYNKLKEKNILVKCYEDDDILKDFIRVLTSDRKINNIFINEIKNIIRQ